MVRFNSSRVEHHPTKLSRIKTLRWTKKANNTARSPPRAVAHDIQPLVPCRHCLPRLMQPPIIVFLGSVCDDLPKSRTWGSEDGPRNDFLTRFSRDMPQYYLCHACLRLHLWAKVALPGPKFKVSACVDSLDHSVYRLKQPIYIIHYPSHAYYKFHFVHLQLAMRRFYYGAQFGIPVQSLLYTEVGTSPSQVKR